MNIIDAIKSGRPCRRVMWPNKQFYIQPGTELYPECMLTGEDVLADDWITEELKMEITESEFWNAVSNVYKEQFASRVCRFGATEQELQRDLMGAVAKELFGKGAGEK